MAIDNTKTVMWGDMDIISPRALANLIQTNNLINQEEAVRQSQEADRQANTATAITNANNATASANTATSNANTATLNANNAATDANSAADNANNVAELLETETLKIYKDSVANYSDLATTYPTPQNGWTVAVTSENVSYRWNGTEWIDLGAIFGDIYADNVIYDNTTSGLAATNTQAAIDELKSKLGNPTSLNTTDKTNTVNAINEVNNNLSKVTHRKIIFIGDSYSEGYVVGQPVNNSNWMDNAISYLHDSNNVYYKCQKGGTSFGDTNLTYNFLQQLKDWESAVIDKASITDIIVCGGRNDFQFTLTGIINGMISFVNYCKTTYPSALVHIGMIGGYNEGAYVNAARNTIDAYAYAAQYGACFIDNIQYSLRDTAYMSADNIHPSEFGQQMLGKNLAGYIKNGNVTTSLHLVRSDSYFVPNYPVFSSTPIYLEQFLINGAVTVVSNANAIYAPSSGINVPCTGAELELGQLSRTLTIGSSDSPVGVYVPIIFYAGDNTYNTVMSQIMIKDKKLVIKPIITSGASGYVTFSNVTRIYVPPFTIVSND